jgi:hypothetical protein
MEWTPFFAWQPYLIDGHWHWLERLERRCKLTGIVDVWEYRPALAAGAQSAETNEDLAQSEGRQSGGSASERNAQSPSPSHTPRGT